jgi:formimidoylglutamate deiminase
MRAARIPAMVNAHSHAFQVGLRGVGERPPPGDRGHDDFWGWREGMYQLSAELEPEAMGELGIQVYAEMASAGYGVVGEFHYVHHRRDGKRYEDPNAMAKALAEAAIGQGLRIVLLPAAYARAGWDGKDLEPGPEQRRFCDPDADSFLERVDELRRWAAGKRHVSVGVAAHSARAVPANWLEQIAAYSERLGLVRHIHASEQLRELEEVRAEHGCSPIELLSKTGFLGEWASVVHGIHVSRSDISLLAASGTTVVSCPLTEGNLGDGYLPALAYRDRAVPLAIGSDSQVRIDPFEEIRELESGARREGQTRNGLLRSTTDLWRTVGANGARCLGLGPAERGEIELDLDHPALAGVSSEDLPLALATSGTAAAVASRKPNHVRP